MHKALINSAGILCCLSHALPAVSFVASPPVTACSKPRATRAGQPTEIRAGQNPLTETAPFQRGTRRTAGKGGSNNCGCWREKEAGHIPQQRRTAGLLQQDRSSRPGVPLESGSRQDDFVSGEVQSREEFEAWRAAAAEAHAASSGGGGSPGDDEAVPAAEVAIEQVYSARASPPGVDWSSLFLTISDQLLFLGFFAWLATPAMRAQVQSSLVFTASGVALGALAAVPMFVYGLYLGTRHWPWLETSRTKSATGGQQLRFFGRNRQVAKVMVVSVPLAALVGFCEECVYRGFFPLLLASKIRLPLAAVVALSAVFCGARHAGTLGSGFDAAVLGMYVHCLLLSTGSMLVPIVAHAVFDAILFVAEHVNDTRPLAQK